MTSDPRPLRKRRAWSDGALLAVQPSLLPSLLWSLVIGPRSFLPFLRRCLWLAAVLGLWLPGPSARGVLDVPVEQKPFAALSDQNISEDGRLALAIRPEMWLHGEIPNFILHFRRITEAKRVALEVQFHLTYVAKVLGAGPERYARKSHVYIFEDEKDWQTFVEEAHMPAWVSSFAQGDDLYLNVREGRTGMFDSVTLAHETTHAIVARLYPGKRWPRWLNEGFAEQMSGASTSARMGQYNGRLLQHFQAATLPLDKLTATVDYPQDVVAVHQFYQSSEKLIRFLMTQNPPERFPKFVDAIVVDGDPLEAAIPKVYGDRYPTFAAFAAAYARVPN